MTIEHDRISGVPRLCSTGREFDRLVKFSTELSDMFFGRFFHILRDFRYDRRIAFRSKNDQVEETLRQTRLDSRDIQALHLEVKMSQDIIGPPSFQQAKATEDLFIQNVHKTKRNPTPKRRRNIH